MTDKKTRRKQFGFQLVLASVLLVQISSTSLLASASSWKAPLRIGVQSALSHHRNGRNKLRSLLATATARPSTVDSIYEPETKTDSLCSDEEWNALFREEDDRVYYASRRTTSSIKPRNSFEESTGFKQPVKLPTFIAKTQVREVSPESYVEADVLPCAAISVSAKQASFTSSMKSPQSATKLRQSPRREASTQKRQVTAAKSAATSTADTGRPLLFWENMVCGAISRSVAQTIMHPANTMKTLLQQSNAPPLMHYMKPSAFPVLFQGAGANFVLSVPHGAINFAVLEMVRKELSKIVKKTKYSEEKIGPALDFMSSAISTICCSVVSTPQMMITDNIMAGNYKNLPAAVRGLAAEGNGLSGFYKRGWWPGLVGKIPSYALTWTFFQQLKLAQKKLSGRQATNFENSIMGCIASGTTVSIMIPMDTIKTRLVTQATGPGIVPYKGIADCAVRILKEEGVKTFYKGLPPRLVSVVPMIGIQFTVYEAMKRVMQKRAFAEQKLTLPAPKPLLSNSKKVKRKRGHKDSDFDPYSSFEQLQESCMEVAASPEHPYPAPHFLRAIRRNGNRSKKSHS